MDYTDLVWNTGEQITRYTRERSRPPLYVVMNTATHKLICSRDREVDLGKRTDDYFFGVKILIDDELIDGWINVVGVM